LKITERRQKQRLYLDLCWIEESLQNAFGDFLEGVGEWQPVERLQEEYNQAIDVTNRFIATVHEDQERYYLGRSKAWLVSNVGCSYRQWMDHWGVGIAKDDIPTPESGLALNLLAAKRFWTFPDAPDCMTE
jgi:hypothetical protein